MNEDFRGNVLKKILCLLYEVELSKTSLDIEDFASRLYRTTTEAEKILKHLEEENYVVIMPQNKIVLTEKARKKITIVLTGGAFELLHVGHLHTLKMAKALGDFLAVVLATDITIQKTKGRIPLVTEEDRLKIIRHLKMVDYAQIGSPQPEKFFEIIDHVKPNIIALGYDQTRIKASLEQNITFLKERSIEIVQLSSSIPHIKSTLLRQKIEILEI